MVVTLWNRVVLTIVYVGLGHGKCHFLVGWPFYVIYLITHQSFLSAVA